MLQVHFYRGDILVRVSFIVFNNYESAHDYGQRVMNQQRFLAKSKRYTKFRVESLLPF